MASSSKHIYFIGIGGVGMSGIALVAKARGYDVSGSDLVESRTSHKLADAGIGVHIGHSARNITTDAPDVVVVSSAIRDDNPELVAARSRGIEVWPRAKMLAYLGRGRKTIAIAGTHGKTTTSSMVATSLDRLGAKPTFLIGGTVDGYDTNALAQEGEYYVVEADESDGSFTFLDPYVAVVTNIDADHLDHYGNIDAVRAAFCEYMSAVPADGAIVICGDFPELPPLARSTGRKVITYGFSEGCDVRCRQAAEHGMDNAFSAVLPDGTEVGIALRHNPGVHNVRNATAALAALTFLGFDAHDVADALSSFTGVRRRFDHVASVGGIDIVDDYAHHPSEIKATIAAARSLHYDRICVLFQPHRYTRTQNLADMFGTAFQEADMVAFMDVYPAGETPIPGISGKTLVTSVLKKNPRAQVAWMPHRADVVPYMVSRLRPGDLLITMGAGDVTVMGPQIADQLREEAKTR